MGFNDDWDSNRKFDEVKVDENGIIKDVVGGTSDVIISLDWL